MCVNVCTSGRGPQCGRDPEIRTHGLCDVCRHAQRLLVLYRAEVTERRVLTHGTVPRVKDRGRRARGVAG